jgi:hypothetical protein
MAGAGWAVGSGAAVCWGRPVSAGPRWSGEREAAAGPDSISSRVSAQYRIRIRKILFFFKSFYNLQTNLNSIQICKRLLLAK